MNINVMPALMGFLIFGGCSTSLKPADFGPVEYLTLRVNKAENVPMAALQDGAVRQATAGCAQGHQAIKVIDRNAGAPPNTVFTDQELAVRALQEADARNYTSATIVFRCVSELAMH